MRRAALGITALGLLTISAYGLLWYRSDAGEANFLWSSCWRMGLVLGAVWLALPKLRALESRQSPLFLAGLVVLGLVLVVRPRLIVMLWPFLLALAVMQFFYWLVKPPASRGTRKKPPPLRETSSEREPGGS